MPETMRTEHYRLISDISAISIANGKPELVTIPANATLTVFYGHGTRFVDAGFVDVVWDSETCTVFASDLEARAERIEPKDHWG